jgi:hypothetical protein
MNYTFKAKEQVYNGVKFRSTLEARWAIFFDACGLKWVYEPECFELDAGNYTPDFYLKKYDLFVEIKPNLDWLKDEYNVKRYKQCPKQLLVLSVEYPSILEVSACYGIYDDWDDYQPVNFCPNSKYEPFYISGYDLGYEDNYWNNYYDNEINAVKKYRFF